MTIFKIYKIITYSYQVHDTLSMLCKEHLRNSVQNTLQERGVLSTLRIIDVPGFSDSDNPATEAEKQQEQLESVCEANLQIFRWIVRVEIDSGLSCLLFTAQRCPGKS